MGKTASEIKKALSQTFAPGMEIFDGFVLKVDEEKGVCDVNINAEGEAELILPDIALRSVADGETDGFVCVPEVNSHVVFAKIEGQSDYVLIKTSKLKKVQLQIKTSVLTIDENGYTIKRDSETLAKILEDFMQELQNVIVVQGTTPNVPAIEAIKTRMKNLLK